MALSHYLYKFHWKGWELYLGISGDVKLYKSFLQVIIITLFLLITELQSYIQQIFIEHPLHYSHSSLYLGHNREQNRKNVLLSWSSQSNQ